MFRAWLASGSSPPLQPSSLSGPGSRSESWCPGDSGGKASVRGSTGLSDDPLDPEKEEQSYRTLCPALGREEWIGRTVSDVLTPGLCI